MIYGVILPDGRLTLEGFVFLPALQITGRVIFLVDTGASSTCLHPSDSVNLGIDLTQLDYTSSSRGVGGIADYSPQDAYLLFSSDEAGVWRRLDLQIAKPADHNQRLPSLLGRDILSQWTMLSAPGRGVLQFDSDNNPVSLQATQAL